MKRFRLIVKRNDGKWEQYKRYKKKKGAIDGLIDLRGCPAWVTEGYNLDVIKIIDSNDNSVSLH